MLKFTETSSGGDLEPRRRRCLFRLLNLLYGRMRFQKGRGGGKRGTVKERYWFLKISGCKNLEYQLRKKESAGKGFASGKVGCTYKIEILLTRRGRSQQQTEDARENSRERDGYLEKDKKELQQQGNDNTIQKKDPLKYAIEKGVEYLFTRFHEDGIGENPLKTWIIKRESGNKKLTE